MQSQVTLALDFYCDQLFDSHNVFVCVISGKISLEAKVHVCLQTSAN